MEASYYVIQKEVAANLWKDCDSYDDFQKGLECFDFRRHNSKKRFRMICIKAEVVLDTADMGEEKPC